jgi:thiamine-phosphate pyrophosphorylase
VRGKQLSSRDLLLQTTAVVARTPGARIVVNDRADVARLAGAAGVHVGQDDLSPSAVRALVGPDAIVGVSTHTQPQRDAALEAPVNYVAIGPVFGTATKDTGYSPVGLARVTDVSVAARRRRLPTVAIGGITLENAASVIDAGAASVAVISDLLATGDPRARTRAYLQRLSRLAV